jgi:hypothetical protein
MIRLQLHATDPIDGADDAGARILGNAVERIVAETDTQEHGIVLLQQLLRRNVAADLDTGADAMN